MDKRISKIPTSNKGDVVHTLVKAGISAVPIAGGPAAEFFNLVIAPPLFKRRDEWLNLLAIEINKLSERIDGFKPEKLKNNEHFISVLVEATRIAIKNHKEEKIDILKNAVLNSAKGIDIEEDFQLIFLNIIDDFSPSHLKAFQCFSRARHYDIKIEKDKLFEDNEYKKNCRRNFKRNKKFFT